MALRDRRKSRSLENCHAKCISAHRKEWEAAEKGHSLVFWKVEVKEGRNTFRFVRFCYCNLTIKVMLVPMVYAPFWITLKG